jgi:hypothetical protein
MTSVARVIIAYGELSAHDASRSITADSNTTNIVVNNGPQPWSHTATQSTQGKPVVIEYLDNPGYLPAVQQVLRNGHLDSAEWIIISNSDIETLQPFDVLDVPEDVAVIGPTFTPSSKHWNPREPRLSRQILLTVSAGIRYLITVVAPRIEPPRRSPNTATRPLDDSIMVHGSCFAIRTRVLKHFTENVEAPRLFGEEVLLGWYLSDHGHRFVIDPNWMVEHHGARSMSLPSARHIAERERLRSRYRLLRMLIARKLATTARPD